MNGSVTIRDDSRSGGKCLREGLLGQEPAGGLFSSDSNLASWEVSDFARLEPALEPVGPASMVSFRKEETVC